MGKTEIYKKDLEKELNEKLGREERVKIQKPAVSSKDPKLNHFYTCLNKIIEEIEKGLILTPKNTKYTSGTIRNLKKSKDTLFKFNPKLDFSTIDMNTYNDFVNWCNEQDYTLNYTGSLIKDWKTFMELAKKKGFSKSMIHKESDFKRIGEDSFQVYLNDEEIQQLYQYDLSNNKYLETIRDRFVINLYTGLRISDMKTLELKNIHKGIITHINRKTGKTVMMPVHPIVEEIIKKYGGELPRQYHENVVNKEIKKIAKKVGLKDPVHFTKTVGGIRHAFVKEKWEMITNHSARRSLTTNLLKHANIIDVMPVTGMSLKTLEKYNKRSAQENANMLKSNPFFARK
jgi:integrase